MIAVDDGFASGNLNAADFFFILGFILGLIAAILAAVPARQADPSDANPRRVWVGTYAPVAGWAAVACIGFGLLQL